MPDVSPLDVAAVELVAARYRLGLPRSAYSGRVGGVLGRQAGGSMELQDFRAYQPGDDVRQIDWNAAARTDQVFIRVRREEVSPLVEVVLDASASMGVTSAKAVRARELAWAFCRIARAQGLEPVLVVGSDEPLRLRPPELVHVTSVASEGRRTLPELLARGLPVRSCGVRIVVSDFLFDVPLDPVLAKLSTGATTLLVVQPLDAVEREPSEAGLVEIVDSETGEKIERTLGAAVVAEYRRRLGAHQSSLEAATRKVRGAWTMVPADQPLPVLFREHLLGAGVEARP